MTSCSDGAALKSSHERRDFRRPMAGQGRVSELLSAFAGASGSTVSLDERPHSSSDHLCDGNARSLRERHASCDADELCVFLRGEVAADAMHQGLVLA